MKQMLDEILKTISVPNDIHDCVIRGIERAKRKTEGEDNKSKDTEVHK